MYRVKFVLVVLSLACCSCGGGLHGFTVVNDSDTELLDLVVSEQRYESFPMTVLAHRSSGTILGVPGKVPESATLTWRESSGVEEFVLAHDVSALLPRRYRSRLEELVFVMTGSGSGYLEFRLSTGSFSAERFIPNEEPDQKSRRIATESIADLARSGAEHGFSDLIAAGGRLRPASVLDPIPVHQAVLSDNPRTVELILDLGSRIEEPRYGFSALTLAVNIENEAIAEQLIRRGADLSFVSSNDTPLIAASEKGLLDTVRLLLEFGANPDQSAMSEFPLISAIRQGHADVVELLLQFGADPTKEFMDKSLIEMAHYFRHPYISTILLDWLDENSSADSGQGRVD